MATFKNKYKLHEVIMFKMQSNGQQRHDKIMSSNHVNNRRKIRLGQ